MNRHERHAYICLDNKMVICTEIGRKWRRSVRIMETAEEQQHGIMVEMHAQNNTRRVEYVERTDRENSHRINNAVEIQREDTENQETMATTRKGKNYRDEMR